MKTMPNNHGQNQVFQRVKITQLVSTSMESLIASGGFQLWQGNCIGTLHIGFSQHYTMPN